MNLERSKMDLGNCWLSPPELSALYGLVLLSGNAPLCFKTEKPISLLGGFKIIGEWKPHFFSEDKTKEAISRKTKKNQLKKPASGSQNSFKSCLLRKLIFRWLLLLQLPKYSFRIPKGFSHITTLHISITIQRLPFDSIQTPLSSSQMIYFSIPCCFLVYSLIPSFIFIGQSQLRRRDSMVAHLSHDWHVLIL